MKGVRNMKLTFLGATKMVTGSSYLLEVGKSRILVDCGMFQGSKLITALNRRDFAFVPQTIDCVLLTHAHVDHSGLIPKLCKQGFQGPIYSTKVTQELCSIMLPDSAHIQEFEAEVSGRKGKRQGKEVQEPLYTVQDAYESLKQFKTLPYGKLQTISPEVSVRFLDAGHILGSAVIEVFVAEEDEKGQNQQTKLVFSGDLGQPDQPIIQDPTIIEDADYLLIESTYGDRLHEAQDRVEKLAQIINDTVAQGGNIVIPSFAVGRTQTLLYYLHQLFKDKTIPDIPVIIDSPLAISATDIFMHNPEYFDEEARQTIIHDCENPLMTPHLTFTKSAEESKAINNLETSAIIISASGMADAGRILHHLKHNLWRPESSVVFVGYQAQGSLGRRILEGVKRVKIMGEEISVRAQIHTLEGFSAHADKKQLIDWISHFKNKPKKVFIVHGEIQMSAPFAATLEQELGLNTYIPQYGDQAVIQGNQCDMILSDIILIDPAIKQVTDSLDQFEAEYREFRQRLTQRVMKNPAEGSDILSRLDKIRAYVRKLMADKE